MSDDIAHEVGSVAFRQKCVDEIKDSKWYINRGKFFEMYLAGTDFDYAKLKQLGYNHFEARNLNAYINNPHRGMYEYALGWE